MIKNKEFKCKNGFNNEAVFLRKDYYEEVCALITDFFEEELMMNDFHKSFIHFLNTLKDYDDVIFIHSEMVYYLAICIIQNDRTSDHLINGKTNDDYFNWWENIHYKKSGVYRYLIEPLDEEEYYFIDNLQEKKIFCKKLYDFVSDLIYIFFKGQIQNNIQYGVFKNRLNTAYIENSVKDILEIEPYEWAFSLG